MIPNKANLPSLVPQWREAIAEMYSHTAAIERVRADTIRRQEHHVIGVINKCRVYFIPTNHYMVLYEPKLEFVDAGSDVVYPWIKQLAGPRSIFVGAHVTDLNENMCDTLHETTERHVMDVLHLDYDNAHDHYAVPVEFEWRRELDKESK